jgi:hypothetical protein
MTLSRGSTQRTRSHPEKASLAKMKKADHQQGQHCNAAERNIFKFMSS